MPAIATSRIAILATHGFEQSELEVPLNDLRAKGATVDIVSLEAGEIKGWDEKDWGAAVPVDRTLAEANVADYDALVLPGGQINPDVLRVEKAAIDFIRAFDGAGKPIAAICHAPWLLIEAGLLKGRRATSYSSIRTDMINAGAVWEDRAVVLDGMIATSRNPGDLDAFVATIVEMVEQGREKRQAAE
ncbi:type 1 glutamine amidotransferase [Aquibium carbonis]|uniref:Type 1 glutamine amidotransferase n=1 Tax=Aquibium carbonis TaxID=2495581 RepID=A0A3R9YTL1_9HYPH|nr:type 1 glutamine amidotransferase domain-containing protein [Aquibium carbonis]RST86791.1 type 1 glutamine amidotransferase [Aquibium carbonis]